MARTFNSTILDGVSGAIGKQIVIKQYSYGTVISAFPDMRRVKRSVLQKVKQGLFSDAVAYARAIIRDPAKKKAFAKKLKKGERVYTAAIKEYLAKYKIKK